MSQNLSSSKHQDRDFYTIPSSSSWFRWDEIHETEKRSLGEFFDGSSSSRNSRVYKEYRDFIINKYREDPSRRLTFTEVRKSLIGDVGSLHRVFLFLERWGLINFGVVDGGSQPDAGAGGSGLAVVLEEGAPAGVKVVPASSSSVPSPAPAAVAGENGFRLPPLTSFFDVFGDWMPRRGPVCVNCGDQCISGRSEAMKGGFAICPNCFKSKKDKQEKTADDLEKSADDLESSYDKDVNVNHVASAWTDAETLLLLEAVLKHGDDWDLIAQHVRTKSKLDCIARLIHLPFGEHMLSAISNKLDTRKSSSEATDIKACQHVVNDHLQDPVKEHSQEPIDADGEQHIDSDEKEKDAEASMHARPLKRRCFPSFADATDSLMKQVALLSTVGGPHVAAAAAEACVTALCQENPSALKAFENDEIEVAYKFGASKAGNDLESDLKTDDWDTKRHKQPDMHESLSEKNFGATTFRIRAAIATALGAAAARAKLLADQEEREMELLMASIIETQLRKLRNKMKHFEELELIMEKEYTQIQQLKERILEEWVSVLQQSFHAGIPRWRGSGISQVSLEYHPVRDP